MSWELACTFVLNTFAHQFRTDAMTDGEELLVFVCSYMYMCTDLLVAPRQLNPEGDLDNSFAMGFDT